MERAVAINQITKILGKKWGYTFDKNAPGADKREEAYLLFKKVQATREELGKQLEARRVEILAADPVYQQILKDYGAARKHAEELGATSRHYRISVGRDSGLFWHTYAEGDSWETIIEELKKKKKGGELY